MKKFKFTLQTLLGQAIQKEKAELANLSQIRNVLNIAFEKKVVLEVKIYQTNQKIYHLDVHIYEIKQSKEYVKDLNKRLQEIEKQIAEIKEKEDHYLERVKEAKKQVNVLENLKDKQYQEYKEKIKKEEEKALEEMIQLKYI